VVELTEHSSTTVYMGGACDRWEITWSKHDGQRHRVFSTTEKKEE
jgi:hypothetical protein